MPLETETLSTLVRPLVLSGQNHQIIEISLEIEQTKILGAIRRVFVICDLCAMFPHVDTIC